MNDTTQKFKAQIYHNILDGYTQCTVFLQENCGYVTQKCDLLPGLSVYQTLRYAANLTIGKKVIY